MFDCHAASPRHIVVVGAGGSGMSASDCRNADLDMILGICAPFLAGGHTNVVQVELSHA